MSITYIGEDSVNQPSMSKEGLPISLVEAASWGLPIISTRVGGIPEICRDGINGFLVEEKDIYAMAEKLVLLAKSPDLRSELGKKSREIAVQDFDQSVQLRKLESIYDRLS